MHPSCDCPGGAGLPLVRPEEDVDLHALQTRVSAEFREMPGLTLTRPQAMRLFSLDAARCERVLGALVEEGVLATDGHVFARADTGARCA
jgi:hypothetical protein